MNFGEPRATLDIDLVILLTKDAIDGLPAAFPDPEYYLPPREILVIEAARPNRGHFNVIHTESGLKADFYPSRDHPYFAWALKNHRQVMINGQLITFAPPEYVILHKLQFLREGGGEKHLRDIRGIVEVQGEALDRLLLDDAVRELRLEAEWIRASEPN